MESCAAGRRPRVIVNLPPGFMKSMLISIMYVAWRLGVDPTLKFVCISYGDDLARKHSSSTRKLMQSPVYRAVFPATLLDKKAEDWLSTTKGGYRYATAVNSDITGFRPTEIIIDDPMEPEEASSELAKERIRSWVSTSVLTRFEDNQNNVFILVMHRIAPDDLAGTLQKNSGYFTLALPLVAEKPEKFQSWRNDVLMTRQPGDLLNPGRMTQQQLDTLKSEIAPHAYESQYQQRPRFGGSSLCSIERLARYDKAPAFELIIHSWDIGATVEGNASVCTKWGLARNAAGHDVLYLFDVVKVRRELPDVRALIKAHDKIDRPEMIILDHRGVGLGIYQEFRQTGWHHVFNVSSDGKTNEGKIDRFSKALIYVYDGLVQFPASAPFMDELLAAFAAFPNLKEFDLVDSVTQLVANLRNAALYARQKHRSRW